MAQDNFIFQLNEDIRIIQNIWKQYDKKLCNDWYAFNYWILNYLYHIDIEDIQDCVTEFNDKGIDCFVHYEESKELYIIQNFYYTDSTPIKREIIADFLISPLHYLSKNDYKRSNKLQGIYNKISEDTDYTVYLYCYTTKHKNSISKDIISLFNREYPQYQFAVETRLICLDELNNIYNGTRFEDNSRFEYGIKISKKNSLEQLSEQHDKENNVDTTYAAVGVYEMFQMLQQSYNEDYFLFDKNIREYLGLRGKRGKTNKEMLKTLLDDIERNRFFYYNNGITIICEDFKRDINNKGLLKMIQPQIVNGCQTVNTICEAINIISQNGSESDVIKAFKHCSILLKIYKVNKNIDSEKEIYEKIVRYTNTQTSITSKDFVSKDDYFLTLQEDFLKRGFYLIVKQSDKHKFESDDELYHKNRNIAYDRWNLFKNITMSGISTEIAKPSDLFIDLDKMLKCLVAFYFDGYTAFKCGSATLNEHSTKYYMNFSKNIREYFSTDNMINLFLTYRSAGGIKIGRTDRYSIPYYLMDFLGRYIKVPEYNYDNVNNKLKYMYSSQENLEEIYSKIHQIVDDYSEEFMKINGVDYSTMTKSREIDIELVDRFYALKLKDANPDRNDWKHLLKYWS